MTQPIPSRCPLAHQTQSPDGTALFVPPYPKPHTSKLSAVARFVRGMNSWTHTLFERSYRMKLGEIRLPRLNIYIANEPSLMRRVLEEDPHFFPKHDFLHELLEPLIGDSVFSTNGEKWDAQRRMVNPSYAHAKLQRVFGTMQAAVDDMLAHLRTLDTSKPIEIDPIMTHVTADVIYRTLFSIPLDEAGAKQIYDAFDAFQKQVQPSAILRIYRLPILHYRKRLQKHAKAIHDVFTPIVKARYDAYQAGEKSEHQDILQSLLEARHHETGEPFSFERLLDQVSFIFLAGHETSASSLTWSMYLLANCPEWQEKLREEIAQHQPISYESMRHLIQTRDVFREALRLYPPVSFFMRTPLADTMMRNKKVEKGALVVISPWLIQRNPDHWECPHAFDPTRFQRESAQQACKDAYLPFSRGPRICAGAGFAQQEATLILAAILSQYTLRNVDGQRPEPMSRLTLRPNGGVQLWFDPNPLAASAATAA